MDYPWDTNLLLHRIRRSKRYEEANKTYSFHEADNRIFLSVINIGEIESLAYQRNWGQAKWDELSRCIQKFSLLGIFHAYAKIDAYSQGKLAEQPLPVGLSARNMGKNDIWLAATAHVGNFTFVTTDHDFDHLGDTFLHLLKV